MLSQEHIPLSHFFTLGIRLFFLTAIILAVYIGYFSLQIKSTINHVVEFCKINSIYIQDVSVDCVDPDNSIHVVWIPCIVAFADTIPNSKNIQIYRNFNEKEFAQSKKTNVIIGNFHKTQSNNFIFFLLSVLFYYQTVKVMQNILNVY
jgi:hypothetical protein